MIKEQIQQQRIEQARQIHGDKYDYSKSDFTKTGVKTCIICREHGEFYQTPGAHLAGQGCPKCAGRTCLTPEERIEQANKVHNYRYDYSKADLTKVSKKTCIICPEHGEFYQNVGKHLKGQGCPKCAGNVMTLSHEEIIEQANKVHNYRYDYSKAQFTKMTDKICIICPEHGEFYQRVYKHLAGQDCPNCVGVRKSYKFNLLKEFESEYALRDFLLSNHVYILIKILSNLCEENPKFKPIEDDIRKALLNRNSNNPIKALEEKYSKMADGELDVETNTEANNIDFDNDEAIEKLTEDNKPTEPEKEITIADVVKSEKNVKKVMSKIEHMVTPEILEQIEGKYVNDKIRRYFDEYGM